MNILRLRKLPPPTQMKQDSCSDYPYSNTHSPDTNSQACHRECSSLVLIEGIKVFTLPFVARSLSYGEKHSKDDRVHLSGFHNKSCHAAGPVHGVPWSVL